ncbi:glycosyltransferase [Streptomyces sp. NPDC007205]|uniref:glycosyltransferase family 2 protein n=1 Tax=Streptomyces sp. NPDC007205 TaxID=3154316 RepID=UPI0033CE5C01
MADSGDMGVKGLFAPVDVCSIDLDVRYEAAIEKISAGAISVIVPVKDNQAGIERLLDSLLQDPDAVRPREIIVVDNGSAEPIRLPPRYQRTQPPIRLLTCATPGAATARNVGAAKAEGSWLLFTDSDCVATPELITGYLRTSGTAIAYAGHVRGTPPSRISRFYDSIRALRPRLLRDSAGGLRPLYCVTANALILKRAFEECGGFDERFAGAGAEDLELSLRLWKLGGIEYAPGSVVLHDFSDGLPGLWKRFVRYGATYRILETVTGSRIKPICLATPHRDPFTVFARCVQYVAMCFGYHVVNRKNTRNHRG